MPTIVTLDFRNAPPAQGGGGTDYLQPGDYRFIVTKAGLQKTKAQKDMIVLNVAVDGGDFDGSRLVDRFVLPASEDDSLFPLQRFHAFLNAVGAFPGEKKIPLDLDKLVNQRFLATVDDDYLEPPPGSNKPPKKITRIVDFLPREQVATPTAAKANGTVTPAAPTSNGAAAVADGVATAPVRRAAPVAVAPPQDAEEEDLPTIDIGDEVGGEVAGDGPEEELLAAPVAAPAPAVRRRATVQPAPAAIETEIDDLFA